MNTPNPDCPICKGLGYTREQQGFFAVQKPCPTCSPSQAAGTDQDTLRRSGYVYILLLSAGILKIGHTTRHPEDRASEWNLTLLAYARIVSLGVV